MSRQPRLPARRPRAIWGVAASRRDDSGRAPNISLVLCAQRVSVMRGAKWLVRHKMATAALDRATTRRLRAQSLHDPSRPSRCAEPGRTLSLGRILWSLPEIIWEL